MSDQTPASVVLTLPENPNLEWLHKTAKKRLAELRKTDPKAKLSEAQFALAKEYGFASWRALKARVDSLTIEGKIIETARSGDVEKLKVLLDQHPDKLHLRVPPYEASLLFPAAQSGNVEAVDLLLKRGLDVNYRERGDNTYAMHWAAAAGKLSFRRTLMVDRPWVLCDSMKSMPSAAAIDRSRGVVMKPRTSSALAPT